MIRRATDQPIGDADYEFCVVGAGPAGLTLALELAERGRRVCVLEAGGESYVADAQQLLDGTVEGDPYPPLRSTRMSGLGGSTRVWAGWCRPLDPMDFEASDTFPRPGWPFDLDHLLPYYRRAHEACGLADFQYDAAFWRAEPDRLPLVEDDTDLVHAMFHVRVRDFGRACRDRLEKATGPDVYLHAPVTRLELDEGGAVRGAVVRPGGGPPVGVRAGEYVLAAGGIENARLLLLSGSEPDRAPGNGHGLVGRYFMDHPYLNPGWLVLDSPRRLDFYFPAPVGGDAEPRVRAALVLPGGVTEREGLPGAALFFHPRYEAHRVFDSPEVRAFLELREKLRSRAVPGAVAPLLARALRAPHRVAHAVLRKLVVRDGPDTRWRVRMMFEPAPRPENRVELRRERDLLDRARVHVRWRLEDRELERMRRTFARFDAAFRRAGVGRLEPSPADHNGAWRASLEGGKHHMGTTRMHNDPRQGVVDEHGRVHGTANLHVTGSSVFPSAGYVNPTLTIVALAIRLADRLAAISAGSAR